MCVCTISSGSRSLTKFKVDEDSSQIKIVDVHVIMAIPIHQKHQIPKNGTF